MPDWADDVPVDSEQKKKRRQRKKKVKTGNNDQICTSTDNQAQGSDSTKQGSDMTTQGSEVTKQVSEVTKQGSEVTKQGSDVMKQGSNVSKQNSPVTKQGSDVTKQGSDMVQQGSDVKKQGSGMTKQGSKVTKQNSPVTKQDSAVTKQQGSSVITQDKNQNKKKKRSRRGLDRYFGRFQCKICRKSWDSAYVFTRAGTRKVVFKQRCKMCTDDDAWVYPYRLELLRCSICQSDICDCVCEECDKLIHLRYVSSTDDKEQLVDDRYEYCDCEKRSQKRVGGHIDTKKPHLAHLCQKCISGYSCSSRNNDEDNEP